MRSRHGDRLGVNGPAVAWWHSLVGYTKNRNEGREGPFRQLLPSLRSLSNGSDGLANSGRRRVGLRLAPDSDSDALQAGSDHWRKRDRHRPATFRLTFLWA